jgi:hypothetical protein
VAAKKVQIRQPESSQKAGWSLSLYYSSCLILRADFEMIIEFYRGGADAD